MVCPVFATPSPCLPLSLMPKINCGQSRHTLAKAAAAAEAALAQSSLRPQQGQTSAHVSDRTNSRRSREREVGRGVEGELPVAGYYSIHCNCQSQPEAEAEAFFLRCTVC